MINNLNIKCEELHSLTPTLNSQSETALDITLLDVDLFALMQQLVEKVGTKVILDHITDADIKNYMAVGNE